MFRCPACTLLNPSQEGNCSGCDADLHDAAPVTTQDAPEDEEGTQETFSGTADNNPGSAEGDRCECIETLVYAPARCRDCGKLGADQHTGADHAGPADESRQRSADFKPPPVRYAYRLRFGPTGNVLIEGGLLIGRGFAATPPDLTNWLAMHGGISRRHCLLLAGSEGFTVVDLGSTNGTSINGNFIRSGQPYPLADDHFPVTIGLGRHAVVIVEREESPA